METQQLYTYSDTETVSHWLCISCAIVYGLHFTSMCLNCERFRCHSRFFSMICTKFPTTWLNVFAVVIDSYAKIWNMYCLRADIYISIAFACAHTSTNKYNLVIWRVSMLWSIENTWKSLLSVHCTNFVRIISFCARSLSLSISNTTFQQCMKVL